MKKLLMFVMILAIATSALAEDPEWAGAPGSMKAYWTYDEDVPGDPDWPRLDAPDEPMEVAPHHEREGPEDLQQEYLDEFEGDYPGLDFTGIYGWQNGAGDPQVTETPAVWEADFQGRDGVLTGVTMMGYDISNFEFNAKGHKDFSVQITWYLESGTPPPEFWVLVEGWDDDGEFIVGTWSEDSIEDIDLGGGWTHSTYYLTTNQTDPEFLDGDDVNPSSEFIEIGTGDGEWVVAIDEVVIHTICYDGDEPPLGMGGDGAIVVDPNITTIYEPEDPEDMGPAPLGPVVGNFGVKLGWMPAEPNIVYVTVDPNAEGDGPNEDYKIQGGDPCDGTVTLAFNQSNYNDFQKVRIEAIKDFEKEGPENFMLSLTSYTDEINGDPNFMDGWLRMNVTVIDNDIRYLSVNTDEIEVSENDPCTCVDLKVRLSHRPADNAVVKVLVSTDGVVFGEVEMAELVPPLIPGGLDPNLLTFTPTDFQPWTEATMTSGWNVEQIITVCAIDNDELAEEWVEYIDGEIFLTPYSEDPGYRVPELNADGSDAPGDPPDSGGEAEEAIVDVIVQDNDCGALGYDISDLAGGGEEGDEPDCIVGLADIAAIYARWQLCTDPYDADYKTWGDCAPLWELFEEE